MEPSAAPSLLFISGQNKRASSANFPTQTFNKVLKTREKTVGHIIISMIMAEAEAGQVLYCHYKVTNETMRRNFSDGQEYHLI